MLLAIQIDFSLFIKHDMVWYSMSMLLAIDFYLFMGQCMDAILGLI